MTNRAHCKAAVVDKYSRSTDAPAVQQTIPNTYIDYRCLIDYNIC